MDAAVRIKDVYEDFEPKADSLFFKTGSHGLISFHGNNYNIKKRMSAEQKERLTNDPAFVQISTDCYVNVLKIIAIEDDHLCFGVFKGEAKRIPVSKRKQQIIKQMLGPNHH
ncbi:LytTR family transcriptional regulator DNA-binding domain-containing protein [Paenibacillus turpanensis]|uniref:LytTR family transcriptional regulator DNA-binding domain-containing protein n=1 Tax=Paenibacillus turpanensis TaxID=2689078 RepID=UPI00140C1D29|nr:LytTR family transcriptional regulator DNA-binding domain-containing protein [Paenibacillus turpanensis]